MGAGGTELLFFSCKSWVSSYLHQASHEAPSPDLPHSSLGVLYMSLKVLLGVTRVSLLPAQAHSMLGWREGHLSRVGHVYTFEGAACCACLCGSELSPLQTAKL